LCVASGFLVYNAKRYFKKGLEAEACRVQTINIVFTTAYITRAIMSFVAANYLEVGRSTFKEFAIFLTYCIGYLFWDVIPLTLIMRYHFQNFLTETADSDDADSNLAESINGSSSSETSASTSPTSSYSAGEMEIYRS